jgi:nicotinamide-nucleotide amidase
MRVALLSIGSEILRGDIVDTNAAFLGRELSVLGFDVVRIQAVPDELAAVSAAVRAALEEADLLLCTGGLGPTGDDLTREGIAGVLGEELGVDESLLAAIRDRFQSMGRRMPASNDRQAMLIPSAQAIPNPNGTAPGWLVQWQGRTIAAMPGPPGEMTPMFRDGVLPRIEGMLDRRVALVSLMTFGLGESALEERIADMIAWHPDVTIATYAKSNGVQVHVTAWSETQREAKDLADEAERRLRDRLGAAVFGMGDDTLAHAVGDLLNDRAETLAVMESCTGGQVANLVTNIPGSSSYFLGGIVAYTPDVKEAFGVDSAVMAEYGVVSAQTAVAMAHAACTRMGASTGIGVTGVAGDDPVEGHPPGTCFIAVSIAGEAEARELHRPGSREFAKGYFAQCALDLLRRQLLTRQGITA